MANARTDGSQLEASNILSTRDLSVSFGGFMAVKRLNLDVKRGTLHALIGPNGAGKTTIFNLLTKFLLPTSGAIFYDGKDITNLAPADVSQLGMVRSFQISAVFQNMTLVENVRLALQGKTTTQSHKFWVSDKSVRHLDEKAHWLLSEVGLEGYADHYAGQLPYGRKRALELATTMALEPELMLLDEPMAGMGREDIGGIAALIAKFAKGRTVLMVEHNLSVVAELCDSVTVLQRGEILAEGSYSEVSSDPRVREAYIGAGPTH